MSFRRVIFFVQFRVFYNKEFTRQKKVTNKLFISVRCVVIARRAKSGRSARWNSVGCMMMWWYMYIEGYIFVFLIYWGLGGYLCSVFACFCLLGVSHFLHFFTFSPIYDFSYEKFLFFFLILFLNKKWLSYKK